MGRGSLFCKVKMVPEILNCREKWDGKVVIVEINGRNPEHFLEVVEIDRMDMLYRMNQGTYFR